MPLYEYKCLKCGRRTEKIENVDGPHLRKCPHCSGKVEPIISAPAIQFKGAGWYVTDYANKTTRGDSDKPAEGAPETSSKGANPKEAGAKDSREKKSPKKK